MIVIRTNDEESIRIGDNVLISVVAIRPDAIRCAVTIREDAGLICYDLVDKQDVEGHFALVTLMENEDGIVTFGVEKPETLRCRTYGKQSLVTDRLLNIAASGTEFFTMKKHSRLLFATNTTATISASLAIQMFKACRGQFCILSLIDVQDQIVAMVKAQTLAPSDPVVEEVKTIIAENGNSPLSRWEAIVHQCLPKDF